MELDDLARLVDGAVQSVFRLETLPQYLVPVEAEDFAAFRAGRLLPMPTPRTSPWLAQIKKRTDAGLRWHRGHVIDYPLTDYMRFEIPGYQANAAAGEEVFIVERDADPDLLTLRHDFWLIDDAVAVLMIYDEEGRFLWPELVDDVASCQSMRDVALRRAEPLHAYLSRTGLPPIYE